VLTLRRLVLDLDPSSVARARRFVEDCCFEWCLDDEDAASTVVVSELVTNALRHATGPIVLIVARRLDRVVVSVEDTSERPVDPYPAEPMSESGRGLEVVEQLSESWGEQALEHGKRVWAEVVPTPR
jgi:anti-sigma regulatory factor (Ser/Thr protein kinase)